MGKIINKARERQAYLDEKRRKQLGVQAEIEVIKAISSFYNNSGNGTAIGMAVCLVAILAGVVVAIFSRGG